MAGEELTQHPETLSPLETAVSLQGAVLATARALAVLQAFGEPRLYRTDKGKKRDKEREDQIANALNTLIADVLPDKNLNIGMITQIGATVVEGKGIISVDALRDFGITERGRFDEGEKEVKAVQGTTIQEPMDFCGFVRGDRLKYPDGLGERWYLHLGRYFVPVETLERIDLNAYKDAIF